MPEIDCLAFSPHPDDAELFCGGLLLKLNKQSYKTAIIDLTQGELSTNGNVKQRSQESAAASGILKLEARENLEIPDGNIEDSPGNRKKVISAIRRYRPAVCLIPYWRDRHPDHEDSAYLLKKAIYASGLAKIETDYQAYRPAAVLHYMMHDEFVPSFVVDISDEMEQKMQAIMAYRSQFVKEDKHTSGTYINRPEFLQALTSRAAFYGHQVGVEYAEAYYYQGMLKINNIPEHFA